MLIFEFIQQCFQVISNGWLIVLITTTNLYFILINVGFKMAVISGTNQFLLQLGIDSKDILITFIN